jgi:hypothetical protein
MDHAKFELLLVVKLYLMYCILTDSVVNLRLILCRASSSVYQEWFASFSVSCRQTINFSRAGSASRRVLMLFALQWVSRNCRIYPCLALCLSSCIWLTWQNGCNAPGCSLLLAEPVEARLPLWKHCRIYRLPFGESGPRWGSCFFHVPTFP